MVPTENNVATKTLSGTFELTITRAPDATSEINCPPQVYTGYKAPGHAVFYCHIVPRVGGIGVYSEPSSFQPAITYGHGSVQVVSTEVRTCMCVNMYVCLYVCM